MTEEKTHDLYETVTGTPAALKGYAYPENAAACAKKYLERTEE